MKNYFNPNPVHWYDGRPFVGRFEFCQYGTTDPLPVYDADGNDLGNIVYTASDGRMVNEVYLDGDYTVRWWLYTGNNANMGDDPDNFMLVYTQSIKASESANSATGHIVATVGTIAELKTLEDMQDGDCVIVTGYYNAGDCPARAYIWDASLVYYSDGGYIVKPDATENGRWVMLWGSDVLPCECYGVFPSDGNTANLNALLGYLPKVGSKQIQTARTVRMSAGTYTSGNFSTDKSLILAKGFFYNGVITCHSVKAEKDAAALCQGFVVTANDVCIDADWVTDASTLNYQTNNIAAVSRSYSITFLKEVDANVLRTSGRATLNSLAVTGDSDLSGNLEVAGQTTLSDDVGIAGDVSVTGDVNASGTVQGDNVIAGSELRTADNSFSVDSNGETRIKELYVRPNLLSSWYSLNSFLQRNWRISVCDNDRMPIPVLHQFDRLTMEFGYTAGSNWSFSLYDDFAGAAIKTWTGQGDDPAGDDVTFDTAAHMVTISFDGEDYPNARFMSLSSINDMGLLTCQFEPFHN